jgi:hypothetical protein
MAVVWVAACIPSVAVGIGQEFIPLGHWSYRAVERFESLGMCDVPTDRPFTRPEFVELVTQITENAFDQRLSARDRFELSRLEKEFSDFASRRDPQARWDPPTFYLEDRPLVFEMDLDLAGIAAQPYLDEFGTEYFGNTNPETRLHYNEHFTYDVRYRLVMGPENGNRARDQKPWARTKSFKGLTSLFERSYVIFGWDKIHFFFGRDYVNWGPSDWDNLITPGGFISLDQMGWRAKLKWFRLSIFNAQLDPYTKRYLAGHRLEMLFSRVRIGLNETVLYAGRDWDPIYAFPLASFYANQFNERTNQDNVMWSIDTKVSVLDALTLYGNLLIDDFQFERDGENPDKLGFDIGGRLALATPVATTWRARYRFVDIYTYSHYDSTTDYVSGSGDRDAGNPLLGGQPGPDADTWRIEGEFYPRGDVVLSGVLFSERIGEGNDLQAYEPGDPIDPPFPSGVVQRSRGWTVRVRWEAPRNSWVEGSYSRARITNIAHDPDDDQTTNAFSVVVRYDF